MKPFNEFDASIYQNSHFEEMKKKKDMVYVCNVKVHKDGQGKVILATDMNKP